MAIKKVKRKIVVKKSVVKNTEKDDAKRKKEKHEEAVKQGRRSKKKGANYEREIAKVFKGKFNVDLTRTPQSGGFAKKSTKADDFRGDIVCLDDTKVLKLHIECKNQKSVSIRKWLKQAIGDCPKDKIPVVIYHLGQIIKDGSIKEEKMGNYITLKLDDFLDLVKEDCVIHDV